MRLTTFLEYERHGPTLIVRPLRNIGCFSNSELQDEWYDLLQHVDDPQTQNLVLDFGRIAYFGSTILEMMLMLGKRLKKAHAGRMVICDLSQLGREIVAVAHFDQLWPITATLSEALTLVEQTEPSVSST